MSSDPHATQATPGGDQGPPPIPDESAVAPTDLDASPDPAQAERDVVDAVSWEITAFEEGDFLTLNAGLAAVSVPLDDDLLGALAQIATERGLNDYDDEDEDLDPDPTLAQNLMSVTGYKQLSGLWDGLSTSQKVTIGALLALGVIALALINPIS